MDATFPVSTTDECYSLIAAVDFTVCWGAHDGFCTLAGIKSLQPSHSQLTSNLCPVVSFKPLQPHEQGITHLRSVDHMNGAAVWVRHCRQWGWNRLLLLEVNGDGLCPGWCRATFTGGCSWGEDLNCEPAELQQHRDWCVLSQQAITHVTGPEVARKVRTRIQWSRGCSN